MLYSLFPLGLYIVWVFQLNVAFFLYPAVIILWVFQLNVAFFNTQPLLAFIYVDQVMCPVISVHVRNI